MKIVKRLIICCFIMLSVVPIMVGCASSTESIVRIHIRANSNSEFDQDVKLKVRDNIVEYITPIIEDCESSEEVKLVLEDNLESIENIADQTLMLYGCDYVSSASIDNEYFPSRDYDGISFPADYYDALIVRLGSGVGDNWWCVAYPPLCFVSDCEISEKIEYRCKIVELISKLFG